MKEKQEGSCREPADCASSQLRGRFCFVIFLAAIIIATVFLTIFTWGKWGDALIDVGRELEIPWRIVEGGVLYRDVAFIHGPFSVYFNALLLMLFGVHLSSIVLGGFISSSAGAVLIYLICRRFLCRCSSLAMVSVFLIESVFQHYYRCGAFNFILPYSVSAVHAVLFSFVALLFLFRYLDSRKGGSLVAAGLFAGLCFLCKLEVAAALFITLAACTLFLNSRFPLPRRGALRSTCPWLVPIILVAGVGYAPFILSSSFSRVFHKVVFENNLIGFGSDAFLRETLGIHNFPTNIFEITASTAFWAASVAAIWLVARVFFAGPLCRSGWGIAGGIAAAALVLGVSWFVISYRTLYRCLPVACITVLAVSWVRARKAAPGEGKEDAAAGTLALFALLMLGRIMLRAGTADYGFFLALPALILFGVFLAGLLPRWLRFPAGLRRWYVFLVLLLILSQSLRNFLVTSLPWYCRKSLELRGPNGVMMADTGPRYRALGAAMRYLVEHTGPAETLVVIPEGAAVNFLTGRRNPTSFNVFIPPEINPVVEDRLIEELRNKQVDMILLVDRRLPEHALRGPGIDYARKLMKFVGENYSVEAKFGMMPYSHPWREGGAILLRRKMPGVHFP